MITMRWKVKVAEAIKVTSVLFALTTHAAAQPTVHKSFEVASVKLLADRSPFRFATTPTSLTARGVPLGYVIRWAYGFRQYQRYQVVGPDWFEPGGEWVQYDIEARTVEPVTTEQMRLMTRALLAERWKLASHLETRAIPVYVMSVAKGGPKLRQSAREGEG